MNELFVFILCVCVVFLVQKTNLTVVITSTSANVDESYLTECTLQSREEAYCIQIYDCLVLLNILNETSLRARKCGPANENRSNPRVCCEKRYIKYTTKNITEKTENEVVKVPSLPDQMCGYQKISSRIVGGETANQGEFPWMARLLRRDTQGEINFSCTGALISSKVVLTTAHCLITRDLMQEGELYAVGLGELKSRCTQEENECRLNKKIILISSFVRHDNYSTASRNHDNDIGLVFLRDTVSFTNYIAPICLLENSMEAFEYHLAGWGMTEQGTVSTVKRKVILPPFTWEQCVEKFKAIKVEITTRQICAGGLTGQDSCQGDSGGPLMVQLNGTQWYVAGVVSFGYSCGRRGWPGVYTNVPSYIDWIKEHMNRA